MRYVYIFAFCLCFISEFCYAQDSNFKGRYKLVFKDKQTIECDLIEIKKGPVYVFQDDFGIIKEIPAISIESWTRVETPTPNQSFEQLKESTLKKNNKQIQEKLVSKSDTAIPNKVLYSAYISPNIFFDEQSKHPFSISLCADILSFNIAKSFKFRPHHARN